MAKKKDDVEPKVPETGDELEPKEPKEPDTPTDDGETPESMEAALAEIASLKDALKKVNSESAERRRKLKAFEDEQEKQRQEQLTELEKEQELRNKAEARIKELETKLYEMHFKAEARKIATELGFLSPDDAIKLIDTSGVSYDEEKGTFSGLKAAFNSLAKKSPYLIGTKGTTPGMPSGGRRGTTTEIPPESSAGLVRF